MLAPMVIFWNQMIKLYIYSSKIDVNLFQTLFLIFENETEGLIMQGENFKPKEKSKDQ